MFAHVSVGVWSFSLLSDPAVRPLGSKEGGYSLSGGRMMLLSPPRPHSHLYECVCALKRAHREYCGRQHLPKRAYARVQREPDTSPNMERGGKEEKRVEKTFRGPKVP